MSLVGTFSICSICGKRRRIANQRNKVLSNQVGMDVYLECKDCASVPLWDRTSEEKQKDFDHYQ
ncbi:MAG TPA: hypothetical protein VFZ60_10350 [Nitrososphaeraceae archaeon]|jgi:hypothetical protein